MGSVLKTEGGKPKWIKFDDKRVVSITLTAEKIQVFELGAFNIEVQMICEKEISFYDVIIKTLTEASTLSGAQTKITELTTVHKAAAPAKKISAKQFLEEFKKSFTDFDEEVSVISQSALYAANGAFQALYGISVDNQMDVKEEKLEMPPMFVCPEDSYGVLSILRHKKSSGFVGLKIPKETAKNLLQQTGLIEHPSPLDITDACKELCNIIAGTTKQELNKGGLGLVEIGMPQVFAAGANAAMRGVFAEKKCLFDIKKDNNHLMTLEIGYKNMED